MQFGEKDLKQVSESKLLQLAVGVIVLLVVISFIWGGQRNSNLQEQTGKQANIFENRLTCMVSTQKVCGYQRCDSNCSQGNEYQGFSPTDKQVNSNAVLYQRVETTGLCPEDQGCTSTTTINFDGRLITGEETFQLSKPQLKQVAKTVAAAPTSTNSCSRRRVEDMQTRYRLARSTGGSASTIMSLESLPKNGRFFKGAGCQKLELVQEIINNISHTTTAATSSNQTDTQTNTNVGTTTDEVVGGFYIRVGNSLDEINIDQTSLPVSPEEFSAKHRPSNSVHELIKVYQDGSREAVPFSLGFCPPYTDVCRATTKTVDLTEYNYNADVNTIIEPSVEEVRIKINNTLVETIERPQQPPKITQISKTKLSGSQLRDYLSQEEYQELSTKQGTLIEWEIEKGSYQEPQVVALDRAGQASLDEGWRVNVIDSLLAGSTTQPSRVSEFLVTEDSFTSGAGQFDFQLRVSDGFHLVTAEKQDFFTKPLNPIGLELSAPPLVYIRTPFFVTIDEFSDPVSSIIPDKRTVFFERDNGVTYPSQNRSIILPSEYQIEWSSPTLPLEEVAQPIRKDSDSPAALRIDIPQSQQYTDLSGSHTIAATVTNADLGISQTATTTVELTSLAEACGAEDGLVKQGCPTTTTAD